MSYRKWETESIGVLRVEWKHKCNKTDLIAPKTTNSINKVLMILKPKKKKKIVVSWIYLEEKVTVYKPSCIS